MRVAVIGPQNTGKSTFIEDFLAAFPDYITPLTTYRDVVQEQGLTINQQTTEAAQRAIRDFLMDQPVSFQHPNAIFDRCVIDNLIYTKHQYLKGIISEAFVRETEACMYENLKAFDALIFIPTVTGVALVDDELRDTDRSFIDAINRLFIDELLSLRLTIPHPMVTVTGSREQRITIARSALSL